jgi:hypothetical protein
MGSVAACIDGRDALRFHRARRERGSGSFKPDFNFYLKLLVSVTRDAVALDD